MRDFTIEHEVKSSSLVLYRYINPSVPLKCKAPNEGLHHLAEHEVKGSSVVLYGFINPSVPSKKSAWPTMRDFTMQNRKSKVALYSFTDIQTSQFPLKKVPGPQDVIGRE
jgi:hypothetical protein